MRLGIGQGIISERADKTAMNYVKKVGILEGMFIPFDIDFRNIDEDKENAGGVRSTQG